MCSVYAFAFDYGSLYHPSHLNHYLEISPALSTPPLLTSRPLGRVFYNARSCLVGNRLWIHIMANRSAKAAVPHLIYGVGLRPLLPPLISLWSRRRLLLSSPQARFYRYNVFMQAPGPSNVTVAFYECNTYHEIMFICVHVHILKFNRT